MACCRKGPDGRLGLRLGRERLPPPRARWGYRGLQALVKAGGMQPRALEGDQLLGGGVCEQETSGSFVERLLLPEEIEYLLLLVPHLI